VSPLRDNSCSQRVASFTTAGSEFPSATTFRLRLEPSPMYATLGIDPASIRLQRKTNSGQLGGRTWRCKYGVITVRTSDTLLRARLQAWMDYVEEQWIDSATDGA